MDSPSAYVPVEVRRTARRSRLSDFSPRAIAWLALAPAWPVWVARRGFPVGIRSGRIPVGQSVAWSPDGKLLAMGSYDKTAKVWDAGTGKEVLTLSGHFDPVCSVAWSPDGKLLATGSYDKTAKVWDAGTGKEVLTLSGHSAGVDSVAWSLDGECLATGSWDNTAKVWDAKKGKVLLTLRGHSESIASVAWSPDGRRLATGCRDRTVKVWDAETGKTLWTLSGPESEVTSVAWSPDGKRLATGSGDHTVMVWDAASGMGLLTLRGHSESIASVAWSPDGRRLATGSGDQTAKVWDIEAGNELLTVGLDVGDSVIESLESMAASGLAESRDECYSLSRVQSAEAIAWLTGSSEEAEKSGSPRWTKATLLEELVAAGKQMLAASSLPAEGGATATASSVFSLSAAIARWAEIASVGALSDMAAMLSRKTDDAIDTARKRKQIACPEAARWLETAHPLAAAFQGPLETVVTRVERQLELFHRESRDEQLLENYFLRTGPEDALRALVSGPDDCWALHYFGAGGMGKTMLLRHIQARLASALGIVTARIDFDRLNPDYPLWAPGLLLMGLAQELQVRASDEVAGRLMSFRLYMEQVHRGLEGAAASGLSVETGIRAAGFQEALKLFIESLQVLAQQARPVLILDTCEELARMRLGGTLPRVERTFEILELLHQAIPSMRVVFSGRRPLAQGGPGWRSIETLGTAEASQLPEPRSYLSVYRIRAFDENEARLFLANYHRAGKGVPAAFIDIILKRSASGQSPELQQIRAESERAETDTKRYNPYDLDLYAAWAASDDQLTEEKLRTTSVHLYVKERITGRLTPALEPWLADLAVMGCFDRALIKRLTGLDEGESSALWEEIRAQEWTDVDRQAISSTEVVMLDPNLLVRLRAYFADEQKAVWSRARQSACSVLREATLERPFSNLTPSYFAVALSLQQPAAAAAWLEQLERKVTREARWDWVPALVDALKVELERHAGSATTAASSPRAGILALEAAAKLRDRPKELHAIWGEVLANTHIYPDRRQAALLEYRAAAGLIADLRWNTEAQGEDKAESFQQLLHQVPPLEIVGDDQDQFSTEIALLENCAEILASVDWRSLKLEDVIDRRFGAAFEWLSYHDHPPLWDHFLRVQSARVQASSGRVPAEDAYLDFEDSLTHSDVRVSDLSRHEYPDWRRPPDLTLRTQLEWMRLLRWRYKYEPSNNLPEAADGRLDADRIQSLNLQKAADLASIAEWTPWERITKTLAAERLARPDCYAHRAIAPYFTAAVELHASSGGVQEAVDLLQLTASDSTLREDTIRWVERCLWHIIQRMRLLDLLPEPQTILEKSPLSADRALLTGAKAFRPGRRASEYAGRWSGIAGATGFEKLAAQLDELEAAPDAHKLAEVRTEAERWVESNPLDVDACATLLARMEALEPESNPVAVLQQHDLGPRRMAEILLDQGMLTALRNLEAGTKLLEGAAALFRSVQDPCGLLIAELNLLCFHWQDKGRLASAVAALREFRGWRDAPPLPDWNSSDAWESKWEAITRVDRVWQPWLIRLLAVEKWQRAPEKPTAAVNEFAQRLRESYRNGFPPDFPLPPWLERRLSGVADGEPTRWPAILIGFGLVAAVFLGFKWILRKLYPSVGWGWSIVLFIVIMGILASIPFWLKKARELWRNFLKAYFILASAAFRTRVLIRPSALVEAPEPAAIDPRRPWASDFKVQSQVKILGRFSVPTGAPSRFVGTDMTEYLAQSIHFAGAPQAEGRRTRAELPDWLRSAYKSAKLRTDLEVTPDAAGVCWEAILGLLGGATERVADSGFRFRRTAPADLLVESIAGPRGVRYLGSRINPWSGALPDEYSGWRLDSVEETDPACVILHLRGEIIEADGVLRFVEWVGSRSDQTLPQIKLETFLRSYPSLRLAVLQAPPLVEQSRLERDRDRGAVFRRAADYLFRNHVAAVVTLPPLPDLLSDQAIHEIARAVGKGGNLVEPLRDAVRAIQLRIDGDGDLPRGMALELAYDVCYYAASEVHMS